MSYLIPTGHWLLFSSGKLNFCPQHFPSIYNTTSMDQSEFAIKNESHHSIKNENDIYLDIPPLSSVKKKVHQCLDNGDGDQPFFIDK